MDSVLDELKKAQDAVHVELLATKVAWPQRSFRNGMFLFLKEARGERERECSCIDKFCRGVALSGSRGCFGGLSVSASFRDTSP